MPSLRDKRVGIQSLVSYFFLDNVDKRIIISTVLLAIFKYGSTSIINPFSWWSICIFRFFGFFRQRLSVNSLFIFLNYFPVSEFFRMSKGEIANSKNMVSIRICPRVDIRRKISTDFNETVIDQLKARSSKLLFDKGFHSPGNPVKRLRNIKNQSLYKSMLTGCRCASRAIFPKFKQT